MSVNAMQKQTIMTISQISQLFLYLRISGFLGTVKEYVLLAVLLLSVTAVHAQGRLSVQLSPGISLNRVHTNPNNQGFSSAGAAFHFKIGAICDYPIRENYYVSAGLLYSTQHLAIKNKKSSPSLLEAHALHYLQTPFLLKLYTSELTLDTRLYAMLGIVGQLKINARNTGLQENLQQPFIKTFRRWGCSGLLGVGLEYDLSLSTSIFVGFSYQYGLLSAIVQHAQHPPASRMMGYSDLLSIDLGVRF
jgi:hypothetical protein